MPSSIWMVCFSVLEALQQIFTCKKQTLYGKKQKVLECNIDRHSWDDELLRHNSLEAIMDRMNLVDCIRASSISKCWRSAALRRKHDIQTAQVPWLVLSRNERRIDSLQFFDLSLSSFYNISLPKTLPGWTYIGSSKGWLVMARNRYINPKLVLYNPISGVQLQLPPTKTIPSFENIMKIEVSCVDASNCIVAASFCDRTTLALCRPEDKSWSIFKDIDQKQCACDDILFYNGILYALIRNKDQVDVNAAFAPTYSMRIGDDDDEVVIRPIPLDIIITRASFWNPNPLIGVPIYESENVWIVKNAEYFSSYLVEDNGELLIVHRIMDVMDVATNPLDMLAMLLVSGFKLFLMMMVALVMFLSDSLLFSLLILMIQYIYRRESHENHDVYGDYEYFKTSKFEVFKIDKPSADNIISNVTRLHGLGDRILFLSKLGSISVQVSKCCNQLKKNCIFFVGDNFNCTSISRESGIFYLEDERIQRCFPNTHDMSWFSPNL